MNCIGIIPARYASSRFPGKPLAVLKGKTILERVYLQALQSHILKNVIVATDDERIFRHVENFGGKVQMTDPSHKSGTDRCAEVALQFPEADVFVNIQGDEPLLPADQIDKVVTPFFKDQEVQIATLAKRIVSIEELENNNVVKVVFDCNGRALYFSRYAIPYIRSEAFADWLNHGAHFKHIGLYAYRKNALSAISKIPQGTLEKLESLEQLRWLENGLSISVTPTEVETLGIDTPEDLEKAQFLI